MVCEHCGERYIRSEAINEFDSYFNYDLSYTSEIDGDLCGECAINYIENSGIIVGGNDDNEMPTCCVACGGPYPECIDSCKIMGD